MSTCLELLRSVFYLGYVASLLLLLGFQLPQTFLGVFLCVKELGKINT